MEARKHGSHKLHYCVPPDCVEPVVMWCAEGRPCIDGFVEHDGFCELPSQEDQTRLSGSGGGADAGTGDGSMFVDEA